MADPRIRRVREADLPAVVALVHDLAEYERAAEKCHLTVDQLRAALFSPSPALFGHVAEVVAGDPAGGGPQVVGTALWFLNFSTWRGEHGIYLEDLYVQPEHRGAGLGKALLAALAAECVAQGYTQLQWAVLDWNTPTIDFYRSLGAALLDDWTVCRLTDQPLAELGGTVLEAQRG